MVNDEAELQCLISNALQNSEDIFAPLSDCFVKMDTVVVEARELRDEEFARRTALQQQLKNMNSQCECIVQSTSIHDHAEPGAALLQWRGLYYFIRL